VYYYGLTVRRSCAAAVMTALAWKGDIWKPNQRGSYGPILLQKSVAGCCDQ